MFITFEPLPVTTIGIGIASTTIMMNAQLLAKSLVAPGQNAQSLQGKPSGSGSVRILEPNQDPSDLTTKNGQPIKDTQGRKFESTPDSKNFKHALNEKMAEAKQEASPEDSPEDSQDPAAATQQAAMTFVQGSPQSPDPQSDRLIQTTVSETPAVSETGGLATTEASLASQAETPDDLVHQPVMPQTSATSPVAPEADAVTPTEPVTSQTSATSPVAPGADAVTPTEPVTSQTSAVSPVPAEASDAVTPPEPAKDPMNTQPVADQITRDASTLSAGVPSEPVTANPVEPKAVISEGTNLQPKQTDTVQPQPVVSQALNTQAPEPMQPADAQTQNTPAAPDPPQAQPQAQPLTQPQTAGESKPEQVSIPEQTPKSKFDIQSVPKETSTRIEGKVEPLNTTPVQHKPQAEAPKPIQVTHPIQQAVTAKLESSHEQPVMTDPSDASTKEQGLERTQSTTPVIGSSQTQATPTSAETSLHRTLDPSTPSVARQIQDSVIQGIQQDSRQIVLRLDPPELGRVTIRFQEDDQGITGVLEVQRSQTRHDIQQALPEIIQHLQNSGVQIKRIEVLLSANADPETFEDQAFSQAQDQYFEQQQTPGNTTAHRSPSFRWSSSSDGAVLQPRQEQYASDQGINMLI